MDLFPLFLIAPILVAVAYFDLRFMRIPNVITLILVFFFAILAWIWPLALPEFGLRFAVAAIVFMIGFIGFFFGLVGAGDVKILSALMLYVPFSTIAVFANVFSASLILGALIVLFLRRFDKIAAMGWKSIGGSHKFPMGLSIAMSGLALPAVAMLLEHY